MIRVFKTYQLVCDVCAKESAVGPIDDIKKGWRWNSYIQSSGYDFYSLTCSDECKARWEEQYIGKLELTYRGRVDLRSLTEMSERPTENTWPYDDRLLTKTDLEKADA